MRIVLHGQQAFGQAVLEKLLDRGEDVVAVCCAPTKEGKPEDPLALFPFKMWGHYNEEGYKKVAYYIYENLKQSVD